MLFFTSGRAPALPRSRDPGKWLAAAQSAVQTAADSVDPGTALGHVRADVAEVARHIRTTVPEIAEDLAGTTPASIRKTVLGAMPIRRRRRSRWPALVLGALALASLVALLTRVMAQRRATATRVDDRWHPPVSGDGDGMHQAAGIAPDVTTRPETLDRDAAIRAAGEGMTPSDGKVRARSLGAAASTGTNGELPYEPALERSPDLTQESV